MDGLTEVATLLKNMRPEMRRLAGCSSEQRIDECIGMAYLLSEMINKISLEFTDHRGNLEQAKDFADSIAVNLIGHKADIQAGKE